MIFSFKRPAPPPLPVPERIVSARASMDDVRLDSAIRPATFADYIGQDRVKENLKVAVQASKVRGEAVDHILLYGPPGLGKTTLAQIISNEIGSAIKISAGPMLSRRADLTSILITLNERDVFFVDEIHRVTPQLEEMFYPAMEDFRIDWMLEGQNGAKSRLVHSRLNRFTLVGATTRPGMISSPMRARFGIVEQLNYYTPNDLYLIVNRTAKILGTGIDEYAALEIAARSRGTPRIANRLVRRLRDFADVRGNGRITLAIAQDALARLGVDKYGLDQADRKLMETIIKVYAGGPVGITTLAASINEDEGSIEEIYEPYLIELGLLGRSPRGRIATPLAYKHFGIAQPAQQAPARNSLFGGR